MTARLGRVVAFASIAVTVSMLATACGGGGALSVKPIDIARAAMRATAERPLAMTYTDASDRSVVVDLTVADAFRYKASVSLDGTPIFEQIVADDAVAAHVLDAGALALFDPSLVPSAGAAFRTGRWTIDSRGAPDPLAPAARAMPLPERAIADALAAFSTADKWLGQGQSVVRFNPQATDYRPKEDPFPKPPKGGRVARFDVVLPQLPRVNLRAGGNQPVPDAQHFRRLGVYVTKQRVVGIRALIDVANRLPDIERIYDIHFPASASRTTLAGVALAAINRVRTSQGQQPIRASATTIEVRPSAADVSEPVSLPTDAVEGSLGQVLVGQGTKSAGATVGGTP
jgi:hypothetical protein